MPTFFVRAPNPIRESDRAVFAAAHASGSGGNQLSIMVNSASTECLVKVSSELPPEAIIPQDMDYTSVITSLDDARALITSLEWNSQTLTSSQMEALTNQPIGALTA